MGVFVVAAALGLGALLLATDAALAQDLEAGRWSHLPTGLNIRGADAAPGSSN